MAGSFAAEFQISARVIRSTEIKIPMKAGLEKHVNMYFGPEVALHM